jgi:hypothetical protein
LLSQTSHEFFMTRWYLYFVTHNLTSQ